MGLALHPDFANSGTPGEGKIYTFHTATHDAGASLDFVEPGTIRYDSVITEWEVSGSNPDVIDVSSRREVMRIVQSGANSIHPGGMLDFGPDGYMYMSVGVPPGNYIHAQELDKVQGKLLRIDPINPADTPASSDPVSANGKYRVPASNPFASDPLAYHEIYATGFRHPYRMSVDHETGLVFVGDVGEGSREEVSVVQAGLNYGWPRWEGTVAGPNPAAGTFESPIAEYSHGDGQSVIGGFVYRGSAMPELVGKYIFAEFSFGNGPIQNVPGRLLWLDPYDELGNVKDPGDVTIHEFAFGSDACGIFSAARTCKFDMTVLGFGEDEFGELYVLGVEGNTDKIYKIVDAFPTGDYNRDGVVDDGDYQEWIDSFRSTSLINADGDGDGRVTAADYTVWRDHVGNSWDLINGLNGSGASAAVLVPEPTSILLALVALFAGTFFRPYFVHSGRNEVPLS